jgi:hypothetical protein
MNEFFEQPGRPFENCCGVAALPIAIFAAAGMVPSSRFQDKPGFPNRQQLQWLPQLSARRLYLLLMAAIIFAAFSVRTFLDPIRGIKLLKIHNSVNLFVHHFHQSVIIFGPHHLLDICSLFNDFARL